MISMHGSTIVDGKVSFLHSDCLEADWLLLDCSGWIVYSLPLLIILEALHAKILKVIQSLWEILVLKVPSIVQSLKLNGYFAPVSLLFIIRSRCTELQRKHRLISYLGWLHD